jgi:hypothetical protein
VSRAGGIFFLENQPHGDRGGITADWRIPQKTEALLAEGCFERPKVLLVRF